MKRYAGKSVYKGIVLGPVVVLKNKDVQIKRKKIEDVELEIQRVERAGEQAKEQLQTLYNKAVREVGEANAAIFELPFGAVCQQACKGSQNMEGFQQ